MRMPRMEQFCWFVSSFYRGDSGRHGRMLVVQQDRFDAPGVIRGGGSLNATQLTITGYYRAGVTADSTADDCRH